MKFNVEIELDWLDEDGNLDERFKAQILDKLVAKILKDYSASLAEKLAAKAEALVKAKTEMLINTALEQPVVVSDGWKKTEYESVLDMVEQQMTDLYKGKLGTSGNCKEDPLLSRIKSHVGQAVQKLLADVDKKLKRVCEAEAKRALAESTLAKAMQQVGVQQEPSP